MTQLEKALNYIDALESAIEKSGFSSEVYENFPVIDFDYDEAVNVKDE